MFRTLDKNNDGVLSREELIEGYSKISNEGNNGKHVDKIMQRLDDNNNGFLDYSEFVMASTNYNLILTKSNIKKIFKMIDKTEKGKISLEDFQYYFGKTNINQAIWDAMIKELKLKASEIAFEDFERVMNTFMVPQLNLSDRKSVV